MTEKTEALRDSVQLLLDACYDINLEARRCGAELVTKRYGGQR